MQRQRFVSLTDKLVYKLSLKLQYLDKWSNVIFTYNIKENEMENNFFSAYYETFCGNEFLKDDWRSYLAIVYIVNNGDVKNFNRQRSLEKFNTFISNPEYIKKLERKLASIIRSREGIEFDLYSKFVNARESYLDAQGDKYRYIYSV